MICSNIPELVDTTELAIRSDRVPSAPESEKRAETGNFGMSSSRRDACQQYYYGLLSCISQSLVVLVDISQLM